MPSPRVWPAKRSPRRCLRPAWPATRQARGCFGSAATAAGFAAAAIAGAVLVPLAKGVLEAGEGPKLAAYGAISACCGAAVVGAVVDRLRRVLDRVLLDIRDALGA